MSSAQRIRDLLPSLWRPGEPAAPDDLLASLVGTVGSLLDQTSVAAGEVMQAHWYRYADSALVSPYVAQYRARDRQPPLKPGDAEVDLHPYLDDLARLGRLLGLAPWREPQADRETVEEFRRRIARIVTLYRQGLGTTAALRSMTLASLPVADRAAPPGLRERGFTVEEAAPVTVARMHASARGVPSDLVGPLMRWRVDSGAIAPTAPEIYIEGIAPDPGVLDATHHPIVERFDPATGSGIGIGYHGTVAAGQTLAILPTVASWVGAGSSVLTARPDPTVGPADPTASGPWVTADGAPPGVTRAFAVTPDAALWAAVNGTNGGALWRLSATGWSQAVGGLPELHCLLLDGHDLLVGHANGLARLPAVGAPHVPVPDPAAAADPAVRGLARDRTGQVWAARATGAGRLRTDDTFTAVGPGARPETETVLNAVLVERDGFVYVGGAAGLFLHDPTRGRWHVYRGSSADETVPDWAPWDPGGDPLPTDRHTYLPEVTSLLRDTDQTLWIGTTHGLAAYRARERRGTYATLLEAFPQLGADPVATLAEDDRQRLWAGTGRGLLTYDGLDWRQLRGGQLTRLPRVEADPLAFTHWRFDRSTGQWQASERGAAGGFTPRTPTPVTTEEPPVTALGWTDAAAAQLGSLAEGVFTPDPDATPADLGTRYKPDALRVLDGGLPAVPRLTPGVSDWRYLSREEDDPPTPTSFPSWTREGRLLPPPEASPAPQEGRYLAADEQTALEQVFAFNPAARVSLRWRPRAALSIVVRLEPTTAGETISAAVLDRLCEGLGRVRPAGSHVALAVGEMIVRGGSDE